MEVIMGLFKKGKNWYIDYYLPAGKRKREMIGENRKLAERVLQKRKVQITEGKFFEIERTKKVKLADLSKTFLESYSKPNKASWRDDEIHLRRFCAFFGNVCIDEITPLRVEEFKRWRLEQEVTPSTVNRGLEVLRRMLYKAIEWGYLKENPFKKVKLYKTDNRRLRFLEKEEIERLLKASAPHIERIILFALNTGMRMGEIFDLQWSGVDFRNNLIYIHKTKNKEKRIIPMNTVVKKLLINIKEHSLSEYVFCTKEGGRFVCIRNGFTKALKRAGITDFRFHDLRHTFASHLVMKGVDLNTIKELLGHKNYEMTLRYAHLSQDHKAKAVEVLGQEMDTIWTPVAKADNDDILYFPKEIENTRDLAVAPVDQLDRSSGYGPEGCRFNSCRARL